jgi:hypothetical protein
LAGTVFEVKNAQTNLAHLIEKLGIREPIRWVLEEVTTYPIVVGYVMILGEESAPDLEHPCDFLKSGYPVTYVMQHSKVKDRVEPTLLVAKISDIALRDSCSVAIISEPVPCSINHLRIEVDDGDASGAKILQLSYDALTGTTADVEDL